MAQLDLDVRFRLSVDHAEMRLINLALSGNLTLAADKAAAPELARKLLEMRDKHLQEYQKVSAIALEQARSATEGEKQS